ncbi:MAG: hypothetical protein OSA93_12400 [Akkermansiaceae bacterium]|jgi:hypothetical protein|nr:hypothetical protein [Akkermansiaceae bacterium]
MKAILISLLGAGSLLGQWSAEQKAAIAEILPKAEETAWLQIGWRTDLWEARREAAKAKKPIYLWEMDGHPLGCV